MLFYSRMGREGVTGNVILAQRPEEMEIRSHADIWGECHPGRGGKKLLTKSSPVANCLHRPLFVITLTF